MLRFATAIVLVICVIGIAQAAKKVNCNGGDCTKRFNVGFAGCYDHGGQTCCKKCRNE